MEEKRRKQERRGEEHHVQCMLRDAGYIDQLLINLGFNCALTTEDQGFPNVSMDHQMS